jgi:hypothetical protein
MCSTATAAAQRWRAVSPSLCCWEERAPFAVCVDVAQLTHWPSPPFFPVHSNAKQAASYYILRFGFEYVACQSQRTVRSRSPSSPPYCRPVMMPLLANQWLR